MPVNGITGKFIKTHADQEVLEHYRKGRSRELLIAVLKLRQIF